MEVVVFTHKRLNILGLPCLGMANRDLSYSDTVKYPGVSLDSKLTFGPHIREKVKKATRLLYCFKTSVGQLWDPSPYLTRWVLTFIVLPKIMYRAMVWVGKASNYKNILIECKGWACWPWPMYDAPLPLLVWRRSWVLCLLTCTHSMWWFGQRTGSGVGTRTDGMALGVAALGATSSGAISFWNVL